MYTKERVNTKAVYMSGHVIVYEYEIHHKLFGFTVFKTKCDNYKGS